MTQFFDRYLLQTRYQMPLILTGWGIWLALFGTFETSVTYSKMALLMPEAGWAVLFGAIGLGSAAATYSRDRRPGCRGCNAAAMWLAALVAGGWLFIVLLLAWGNYRSSATYIYTVLFGLSLLNFLDLSAVLRWRPTDVV